MSSISESLTPTIVIKPKSGWQLIDWRELIEYRDLFYFLIKRDVLAIYKQTVLGFTWAIIRPVFSMIVFSVIFGGLAKIPSDGIPYPIFSYAALIPWTYFSAAMNASTPPPPNGSFHRIGCSGSTSFNSYCLRSSATSG